MSNQTSENALAILDKAASEGSALARSVQQSFSSALGIARVANVIRNALSVEVVQEAIIPLKNVDFGWRTDNGNYSIEQIRDCWVSAALAGAKPVNNEMNIIAGRMYLTQSFFRRVVREFPGVADVQVIPGKILTAPGGATVEMTVLYKLNGKEQKVERLGSSAIPVRLNAGMGADGAIGKATRKVLKSVYERLTGSMMLQDGDVDDSDTLTVSASVVEDEKLKSVPSKSAAVADHLKAMAASKTPATVAEAEDGPNPWEVSDGESGSVTAETEPAESAAPAALDPTPSVSAQIAQGTQPSQPAKPAKDKKPRGGYARDTIDGEFKKVDVMPSAPAVVVPSVSQSQPAQAEPSPEKPVEGDSDSVTRDAFVSIVVVKDAGGNIKYYKAGVAQSSDIYATTDKDMAAKIKNEWKPRCEQGEVVAIEWIPGKIAGQEVRMIVSVSEVSAK